MDDTTFADEFHLSFILPTKSLQRIITSINGRMTQLILSTKQNSFNSEQFSESNLKKLTLAAKDIVKVLKRLAQSIKESINVKFKNDVVAVDEIELSTQNLLISSENLLLCSQMLFSMAKSRSFHNIEDNSIYDLTSSVSKVFQNLTILLICLDNAETRSIIKLAQKTLQDVISLVTSRSLQSFSKKFKFFSDSAHEFFGEATKRCNDLLDTGIKGRMMNHLNQFKHSISMLVTSFTISIKYPNNIEARKSKDFAYNQINKAVDSFIKTLQKRESSNDVIEDDGSKIGIYVRITSSIERILSVGRRVDIDDLELMTKIQSLVHNYITLVTLIRKSELLVTSGAMERLIDDVKAVTKHVDEVTHLISSDPGSLEEIGVSCRSIKSQLNDLFRNAKHLVTLLFAQTFVVTSEPLLALSASKSEEQKQAALQMFLRHVNDVIIACRLTANCCSSSESFKDIDCSVRHLKAISQQVVATSEDQFTDDPDLNQEWIDIFNDLLSLCSSTLDIRTLISLILKDLIRDIEKVHTDIVNLDESNLSKNIISATARAKLLTSIGKNEMSETPDMKIRNTIIPLIKKTDEAILLTVANSNSLLEDLSVMKTQEAFIASASYLKDCAKIFCKSLLNNPKRPKTSVKVLDASIRDFSDTSMLVDMVQEMSNLNNKLSSAGFNPSSSIEFISPQIPQVKNETEQVDLLLGTSGEVVPGFDIKEENNQVSARPNNKEQKLKNEFLKEIIEAVDDHDFYKSETMTVNIEKTTDTLLMVVRDLNDLMIALEDEDSINQLEIAKSLSEDLKESLSLFKIANHLSDSEDYDKKFEQKKHLKKWKKIFEKLQKILQNQFVGFFRNLSEDDYLNANIIFQLISDVVMLVKTRNLNKDDSSTDDDFDEDLQDQCYNKFKERKFDFISAYKKVESFQKLISVDSNQVLVFQLELLQNLLSIKFNRLQLAVDEFIELCLQGRNINFTENCLSQKNLAFKYNLCLVTTSKWLNKLMQRALEKSVLEKDDILKVKKAHIRCEVTKKGIEEIIKFNSELNENEKQISTNSHVVTRFAYLHRRFMLEVARLYFLAKSFNQLENSFEIYDDHEHISIKLLDPFDNKTVIKSSTPRSSSSNQDTVIFQEQIDPLDTSFDELTP